MKSCFNQRKICMRISDSNIKNAIFLGFFSIKCPFSFQICCKNINKYFILKNLRYFSHIIQHIRLVLFLKHNIFDLICH